VAPRTAGMCRAVQAAVRRVREAGRSVTFVRMDQRVERGGGVLNECVRDDGMWLCREWCGVQLVDVVCWFG